jgi:hypothetical protein
MSAWDSRSERYAAAADALIGCEPGTAKVKTPPPQRPRLSELGRLDSLCPYCECELARRPERKTRCPHCGGNVFVRIRPIDRERVLLTEQQTSAVEAEWTALQLWMKRRRETRSE